jgi:hypothetical protein
MPLLPPDTVSRFKQLAEFWPEYVMAEKMRDEEGRYWWVVRADLATVRGIAIFEDTLQAAGPRRIFDTVTH